MDSLLQTLLMKVFFFCFFTSFVCLLFLFSYIKCCLCLVHSRFGLPPETDLHIYDDTETEIDKDILQDVLNARPDTSLIIVRRENEGTV